LKLYRFDVQVGKEIHEHNSRNVIIAGIIEMRSKARVSCVYLGANGRVGYHPARSAQLFCVVAGEGWVRGNSSEGIGITVGHAAYWEAGEWHESGTMTGMTVVVVESETLVPSEFMPAVN
jgi:hypothetical protein